tara:strand:+ start:6140 stop:6445 length:306 start_codon:yes stop_codon:yes gene_type:complete
MDEPISFSLAEARVKTTERSKGRMKIQIKLSKEQAEGFSNFRNLVKPPDMGEDAFSIQVFFAGCNALAAELRAHAQSEMAKQEELDSSTSGTTPVESTTDE